jgi:hypothetical protein|eukprot:COSAG02_NODE_39905_length_411_cov_0.833333_1_plen_93_part_00
MHVPSGVHAVKSSHRSVAAGVVSRDCCKLRASILTLLLVRLSHRLNSVEPPLQYTVALLVFAVQIALCALCFRCLRVDVRATWVAVMTAATS